MKNNWSILSVVSIVLLSFSVSGHAVYADKVSDNIPLGCATGGIVFDPFSNYMYTICGSNQVAIISGTTVIANVTVGTNPSAIAFDSNHNMVYVTNSGSNTVSVIADRVNIATIPVGINPFSIVFNPSNSYIYVANGDGTVSVISGTNLVGTVTTGGTVGNDVLAFNPSNNDTYEANWNPNTVSVISGTTLVNTISLGQPYGHNAPRDIAFNPSNNDVYVSDNAGVVHIISGTTVIANVTTGVGSGDQAMAFNPSNNDIYLTGLNSFKVVVLSNTTDTAEIDLGYGPRTIAYDPFDKEIYTANDYTSRSFTGGTVSSLSGTTVIDTVSVGIAPTSIAFNPFNDEMYVSNGPSNTISVVDFGPPSIPSEPTALQSYYVTSSEIDLGWNAPQTTGGYPITGYKIERSTDGGVTWSWSITVPANTACTGCGNSASQTYSDTGLQHSTTYTYRVSAMTSAATSYPCYPASATTLNTIPSQPLGLNATKPKDHNQGEIDLNWIAPTDNGGSPITGYEIERSTDNGVTWSTVVANTGNAATTYDDTGLASKTTYTYRISAINSIGTSPPSNIASAKTF